MTARLLTGMGPPVDPNLFVDVDGETRLRGSRCDDCATVTFPAQGSCPRCAGEQVCACALAAEGELWAFTVQRFPPKPPYRCTQGSFRPYGVGYVDLGHEVLVEGRITTSDIDALSVGQTMIVVGETLACDDGATMWTFAFAPASGDLRS